MRLRTVILLPLIATLLAGCNESLDAIDPGYVKDVKNKTEQPLSERLVADMKAKGMDRTSPIAIRIFKEEGVLEIWKARTDSRFEKIKDYKICAWSGRLGPKVKEGDRQAPEGFYPLSRANMNPYSQYFLAINTGFPNRYDAANKRNGTNLMIPWRMLVSGCYSMTDAQILEIWAFARDAFKGGQQTIQLQAFPFRMTAENMAATATASTTNSGRCSRSATTISRLPSARRKSPSATSSMSSIQRPPARSIRLARALPTCPRRRPCRARWPVTTKPMSWPTRRPSTSTRT